MNTLLRSVLCLGTVAAGLQSSHAAVFVFGSGDGTDSFSNSADGVGGAFASSGPGGPGEQRAGGFTTGSVSGTLDHISLVLAFETASTTFTVKLYSDAGGAPGTPLGTALLGETTLSSGSPSTFITGNGGGLTLAANTSYWLVVENLGNAGGGNVLWTKSDAGNGTPPTAANGSGYTSLGFQAGFADDFTDGALTDNGNFAVYTTSAVPEPQEYAMIAALGLCGFAAYRRRSLAKA